MLEVVLSAAVSVAVGLALWAFLPRGVVLTRQLQVRSPTGEPQYQTWEIRNASALPVTITSVTYCGANTYNADKDAIEEVTLLPYVPHEEAAGIGVTLQFDDEVLELTREDNGRPWRGQKVPPGDTLTAFVNLNRTLTLRYRRSGLLGVFERRSITIDGGV